MKKFLIGYYTLLSLFTVFVLLWAFLIPHGGITVDDYVATTESTSTTTEVSDSTYSDDINTTITTEAYDELSYTETLPTVLENAEILGYYENDHLIITIYTFRMYNSDVYVADVVVSDATQILNAFAYNNFGGSNYVQTVSEMAEDHDAIFAINADYASHYDEGIVIRNGTILRTSTSTRDSVALWYDGTLSSFDEDDTSAEELLNSGAWQVWSFGPVLISDGEVVADNDEGPSRNEVNNPRSAIGMVSANHFMFLSVDGRSSSSDGVDVEELADIFVELNCTEAYNFDGGGSATMWFEGEVINNPSEGSEREVGDCVYITA